MVFVTLELLFNHTVVQCRNTLTGASVVLQMIARVYPSYTLTVHGRVLHIQHILSGSDAREATSIVFQNKMFTVLKIIVIIIIMIVINI